MIIDLDTGSNLGYKENLHYVVFITNKHYRETFMAFQAKILWCYLDFTIF